MKHILGLVGVLTLLSAGCSANPYIPLRDENRANLIKLDLGMTKAQAIQTMGDTPATGRYGTFTNPYKREILKAPTGETGLGERSHTCDIQGRQNSGDRLESS